MVRALLTAQEDKQQSLELHGALRASAGQPCADAPVRTVTNK